MRTSDVFDFVLLALLWGMSFLFMRVAVPEFGPVSLMLLRCGFGAITLLVILRLHGGFDDLWRNIRVTSFTGVINSAIPFVLLAIAAISLTTGTLSVLNATAPFWGALVGYFWLGERLTAQQVAGLVIGFIGVFVLAVSGPSDVGVSTGASMLAMAAALGATFAYGVAANFAKRYLSNDNALANATGSQIGATVVLLIPGIVMWPAVMPGINAWLSIILLGVFSTGIAYILFFRLIKNLGPTRAITVTFLIPVFGTFFGWLILNETVNMLMVLGAIIVIAGCSLTIKLVEIAK